MNKENTGPRAVPCGVIMIISLNTLDSPLKVIMIIIFTIQLLTVDCLNSIINHLFFFLESPNTFYEFCYM